MSRYDKYGARDDRTLEDMDAGFIGFNNRLRPDQLPRGVLEVSKNGRCDRNGEWSVRLGTDVKASPIAVGADALTVPFLLGEDDSCTVTQNSATQITISNYAYVGNVDATQNIPDTGFLRISNAGDVSGADGTHEYSVSGSNIIITGTGFGSGTDTSATVVYPALQDGAITNVYGSGTFSDPNSADNESYILLASDTQLIAVKTSTFTSGQTLNPTTYTIPYEVGVDISEDVEILQAFNKVILFRKGGQTALECDLSINKVDADTTADVAATAIVAGRTYKIQTQGTSDFTLIGAPNNTVGTIFVATKSTTGTGTVRENPQFTPVPSGEYIQPREIACLVGEYAQVENRGVVHKNPDNYKVGDEIEFLGEVHPTNVTGLIIGKKFTVNKVFEEGTDVAIQSTVNNGNTHGNAEYNALYKITVNSTAHGLSVGDPITMSSTGVGSLDGDWFVAEVTTADAFVIYITSNASNASTGNVKLAEGFEFFLQSEKTSTHILEYESYLAQPVFSKRVPVSLGYIYMPAPEFGILHQRRLIVPYQYDPENNNASRNIYDELIVSDILDNNTYDKIYASFRFNAGSTDFTVGVVSFTEDSILIFNKNTIHRVSGTTDPAFASSQILTNEIGALARKSIVQVGKNVFFLSDNGVYSLEFLDEYNLRGTQTPLSESIQSTIDRINKGLASKSVAAYFDNRYYLAVPLDSSPGANDAVTNNALLVYNFLTQAWESIDTVNISPTFEYTNLVIAGKGERRGLYVVNVDGGVHLIAGNEAEFSNNAKNGNDTVITTIGSTTPESVLIDGEMKTRMYTFNDIDRKKYNSFEIQSDSSKFGPTNYQIDFLTENIDTDTTLGTLRSYNGDVTLPADEDVAIRGRIGNKRAYGGQFRITNKEGKPSIRAIKLSAAQTFRSTNKAE
jgi:hypothetical protein